MVRKAWTRGDLLLALVAYLSLSIDQRAHPPKEFVAALASRLGRGIATTSLRLANYAARDPSMKLIGVKGMAGGGDHVDEIWTEFNSGDKTDFQKLLRVVVLECFPLN